MKGKPSLTNCWKEVGKEKILGLFTCPEFISPQKLEPSQSYIYHAEINFYGSSLAI